jgi:hypothetical protein
MVRVLAVLSGLLLPIGAETYHAACLALDPVTRTIYMSDPFEQECAGQLAACRTEVMSSWTAFLKKEGLAQTAGAARRCEMFSTGSTPDESPRARVRKWRDEEAAQTQQRNPGQYTKVAMTTYEPR